MGRRIKFQLLGQDAELHFEKLGRQRAEGLCDPPGSKPRRIRVDSRLVGKNRTEVIIHECLHLAGWHLDESFIEQFALDVSELLEKVKEN